MSAIKPNYTVESYEKERDCALMCFVYLSQLSAKHASSVIVSSPPRLPGAIVYTSL